MAAAQRRLLADDPGLQRVPVLGVAQPVGPGAPDPAGVSQQVLHVPVPEVTGDLIQRRAAVRGVTRVADPHPVQDGRVPRVVEHGHSQSGPGLPAGQFIQQLAEAQLGETRPELIQPGQLPRGVLVRGQLGELSRGVLGQRDVATQQAELGGAVRAEFGQLRIAVRQPGQAGAGAQLAPLGQLAGGGRGAPGQLFPGRLGRPGGQRAGLLAQRPAIEGASARRRPPPRPRAGPGWPRTRPGRGGAASAPARRTAAAGPLRPGRPAAAAVRCPPPRGPPGAAARAARAS